MFFEVFGSNTNEVAVDGLAADTDYTFSISAFTVSLGDFTYAETASIKTLISDGMWMICLDVCNVLMLNLKTYSNINIMLVQSKNDNQCRI